jgi:Protein of unknown function (DUF3089)
VPRRGEGLEGYTPFMRLLACLVPLSLLSASCGGCAPCDATEASALDYDADDSWACRPGAEGACARDLTAAEVAPDGSVSVVEHTAAQDPALACFWVYPTVDLSALPDTHEDFTDTTEEDRVVAAQAARFSSVCTVHAPYYRQVNLGVYTALVDDEERAACFDVAVVDVVRAFETFLEDIGDRPFVIAGHSQGAHMISEVTSRVIEESDALFERMVAAMPVGWLVGTAAGELSGGTFARAPLCTAPDETGCVLAFRSFGAGNDLPAGPASGGVRESLFKGEEVACTNPAQEDGAALARSYFSAEEGFAEVPAAATETEAPYVLYRDAFTARCVKDGSNAALELTPVAGREDVMDFERILLSGDSGSHLLDMHFALGDLIDQAGTRAAAWAAAHPTP